MSVSITPRVALADSDDDYRRAFSAGLARLGFSIQTFDDAAQLRAAALNGPVADIIALEWNFPHGRGLDLLVELRALGIETPIVFLTCDASAENEHRALDAGASAFIDKQRSDWTILDRRLRRIAGMSAAADAEPNVLRCGHLILEEHAERALWKGSDVRLSILEFRVVRLLAENAGHFLPSSAIDACMRSVSSPVHGDFRHAVRVCVNRARSKFRLVDADFEQIQTYRSYGYRWKRD
jgi:two-component system, OmpR family, response regulator ChvI